MSLAALYATLNRKTVQCPWTEKSMKKMWCIHTLKCDTEFKREGNPVIGSNMNEARGHWKTEISQSQEDKYCTIPFT